MLHKLEIWIKIGPRPKNFTFRLMVLCCCFVFTGFTGCGQYQQSEIQHDSGDSLPDTVRISLVNNLIEETLKEEKSVRTFNLIPYAKERSKANKQWQIIDSEAGRQWIGMLFHRSSLRLPAFVLSGNQNGNLYCILEAYSDNKSPKKPNVPLRIEINGHEIGSITVTPDRERFTFCFKDTILNTDTNLINFIRNDKMLQTEKSSPFFSKIHFSSGSNFDQLDLEKLTPEITVAEAEHFRIESYRITNKQSFENTVMIPTDSFLYFHILSGHLTDPEKSNGTLTIMIQKPGDGSEQLWSIPLEDLSEEHWSGHIVSLKPWTNKRVRLTVSLYQQETRQDSETVIFWGQPLILQRIEKSDRSKPNIVFILIDTLRSDRLGSYGCAAGKTPEIDRISKHSLVFTNVTAPAPSTLPSVMSLFTGRFPLLSVWNNQSNSRTLKKNGHRKQQLGMQSKATTNPKGAMIVDSTKEALNIDDNDGLSLADIFQQNGYRTVGFTTNPFVSRKYGFDQGFDFFDDNLAFNEASDVLRHCFPHLFSVNNNPLFLYLHLMDPHNPYHPPPDYTRQIDAWEDFKTSPQSYKMERFFSQLYDQEISYTDRVIGYLSRILNQTGGAGNTAFFIASDHGEEFREHGNLMHNSSLHREQVSIPLIISTLTEKGRFKERISTASMSLVDILPTFFDFFNQELNQVSHGHSFYHVLQNTDMGDPDKSVFSELNNFDMLNVKKQVSMKNENWKLIHSLWDKTSKLYDLDSDPQENSDLSQKENDKTQQLLNRLHHDYLSLYESETRKIDRDRLKQDLQALGYIE